MARLVNLEIEHFRGIRSGKLTDLAEVNILIGRNNSGKSSVLEAICLGADAAGVVDQLGRTYSKRWMSIRNAKEYPPASRLNPNETMFLMRMEFRSNSDELVVGILKYPPTQFDINRKWEALTLSLLQGLTLFSGSDRFDSAIENRIWLSLLKNRRDKLLLKSIKTMYDVPAEQLQLMPSGEIVVVFEDYTIPLDSMGDGTRAAMRALMCLAMIEKTLFLMEEPECHQHPAALEAFAKGMCAIAKKREIQIILTTHSMECIRAFRKATQESESTFAVHHLSLNDGVQKARRLDGDAFDSLDEGGLDVRYADLYV